MDVFDRDLSVAIATLPVPVLVARVVAPLLREVGVRWADGRLANARYLVEALGVARVRAVTDPEALARMRQRPRAHRVGITNPTLA
ncbi:hypothetical protein ACW5F0_01645 [Luteimonas sp. A534]